MRLEDNTYLKPGTGLVTSFIRCENDRNIWNSDLNRPIYFCYQLISCAVLAGLYCFVSG